MKNSMNLAVIGAGFGRTGTDSMRLALEQLGFAPCHHMRALFNNDEHRQHWLDAVHTDNRDWDLLLGGYRASVDWPSIHYWRELATLNPEASVLLTWREPESWWRSMSNTIVPYLHQCIEDDNYGPGATIILRDVLKGQPMTRENFIAAYNDNVTAVINTIKPERLLVYELGTGWEPLCSFLKLPVPDTPYPKTNDSEQFHQWVKPS